MLCATSAPRRRHRRSSSPAGWLLALPERAYADSAVSPKSGNFTVRGAGFGHGWGMSQYGAYGAARKGLSWEQILGFYYPGTKLTKMASGTTLRVWVTGDTDGTLRVRPASGLDRSRRRRRDASRCRPGSKYRSWRISRSGSGYRLTYRNSSGSDVSVSTGLSSGTWSFSSSSKIIEVIMPSGSVRPYRGSVALVKRGSSGRTVNRVLLEDYVKGVVASEMPTSWHPEAVRAQTVAARSYAVRIRDFYSYDGYDICDTTACQVYGGINRETAGGNAAVRATERHDRHLQGRRGPDPVRLVQRRALRAGRLPVPGARSGPVRRRDQVAGLDPDDQREQHRVPVVRSARSEAADHQPRRRRRLGRPGQLDQDHRQQEDGHGHRLQLLPRLRPALAAVHLRRVVRDTDAGAAAPGPPRRSSPARSTRPSRAATTPAPRSTSRWSTRPASCGAIRSPTASSAPRRSIGSGLQRLHPRGQRRRLER